MYRGQACAGRRRSGPAAVAIAVVLGLSLGQVSLASAQTPAEVELAQVSALTSTCLNLISALPGATTQDVYEAQIAAAIEAAGVSGELAQRALADVLKVRSLPAAAVAAVRSLLAKGLTQRNLGTASLGNGGGPALSDSLGGGGGSDY